MRFVRFTAALAAIFLAAPARGRAQQADPVMPRSGSWGAEALVGSGFGANLLRFSSPTSAWLVGLTFSATRESDDITTAAGNVTDTYYAGYANARIGRRWWRGSAGERIRPLAGAGALGSLSSSSNLRSWTAGGYGEIGATYFFSPRVSLGTTGELTAAYGRDRYDFGGTVPGRVNTRWTVGGSLVRVAAGVYF